MTSGIRLVSVLLSLHHIIILNCLINLHTCDTLCQFPREWTGEWFERDETELVEIRNGTISSKGTCVLHGLKNKYILRHPEKKSYMCVVIHQKHINLLQYKQSYWHSRLSLSDICHTISGDYALLSAFRVNADPVPCPFSGRYTFTYNRGHRDCVEPKSSIDPCTNKSSLHFKFQPCYDVPGSQFSDEQLECLASWSVGPEKYVVGKMHRTVAKTNHELYRCYIYSANEDETGYEVAESADASCDGVALSPLTGARIMKLQKVEDGISCEFPKWMTPIKEWYLLNKDGRYIFQDKGTLFAIDDSLAHHGVDSNLRCIKTISSTDQYAKSVVHVTSGCSGRYMCMEFFRRNSFVVQFKQGEYSRHSVGACSDNFFNPNKIDYLTLKAQLHKSKHEITASMSQAVTDIKYPTKTSVTESEIRSSMKCPYHGEYVVTKNFVQSRKASDCNTSKMSTGCTSNHHIDVYTECPSSTDLKASFYCHGNWTDGKTHYVLASKKGTKDNYCFSYEEHDDGLYLSITLSECGESSSRMQNANENRILLQKRGKCPQNNRANPVTMPTKLLLLSFVAVIMSAWQFKIFS